MLWHPLFCGHSSSIGFAMSPRGSVQLILSQYSCVASRHALQFQGVSGEQPGEEVAPPSPGNVWIVVALELFVDALRRVVLLRREVRDVPDEFGEEAVVERLGGLAGADGGDDAEGREGADAEGSPPAHSSRAWAAIDDDITKE